VVEPVTGAAAEVETLLALDKVVTEAEEERVIAKVDVVDEVVVVHQEEAEAESVVEDVEEDSRVIPHQHRRTRLLPPLTPNLLRLVTPIFPCCLPKVLLLVHLLNGHYL
jgi:hypothetical protein